ncbi:MAG TPA: hypothetical protein VF444_02080 [Pseudonocardiaceae bacterium]
MLRMAIRFVTLGSLAGALALSVWWWSTPGTDWLQAPSQTLALLAALSGIPADRWAAAAERRGRTLAALHREALQNRRVLADPRFAPENQGVGSVYPRIKLGAVDTAFISGALHAGRDEALVRQMLDWRNAAEDLNRRLDITELRLGTVEAINHEELALLREIARRPGGYFAGAARQLDELVTALEAAVRPNAWQRWIPPFVRRVLDLEPDIETTTETDVDAPAPDAPTNGRPTAVNGTPVTTMATLLAESDHRQARPVWVPSAESEE